MGGAIAAVCLLAGCGRPDANRLQGYVEGEFVYVASPLAGALEKLFVQRGTQVKTGSPLFALEGDPEKAARDEADRRHVQARANLEDAKKGKRPTEIESIEAQLDQARAALALSEKELSRQETLLRIPGGTSVQDADRARSARDQDLQRVAQREAELKTARLGLRSDQVAAAEAETRARKGSPRAGRSSCCCRRRTSRCAPSCRRRGSARFVSATRYGFPSTGCRSRFPGRCGSSRRRRNTPRRSSTADRK